MNLQLNEVQFIEKFITKFYEVSNANANVDIEAKKFQNWNEILKLIGYLKNYQNIYNNHKFTYFQKWRLLFIMNNNDEDDDFFVTFILKLLLAAFSLFVSFALCLITISSVNYNHYMKTTIMFVGFLLPVILIVLEIYRVSFKYNEFIKKIKMKNKEKTNILVNLFTITDYENQILNNYIQYLSVKNEIDFLNHYLKDYDLQLTKFFNKKTILNKFNIHKPIVLETDVHQLQNLKNAIHLIKKLEQNGIGYNDINKIINEKFIKDTHYQNQIVENIKQNNYNVIRDCLNPLAEITSLFKSQLTTFVQKTLDNISVEQLSEPNFGEKLKTTIDNICNNMVKLNAILKNNPNWITNDDWQRISCFTIVQNNNPDYHLLSEFDKEFHIYLKSLIDEIVEKEIKSIHLGN